MKHIRKLPSLELLESLFEYDKETGDLTWKVKTSPRTNIGDIAGYTNKSDGYRMLCVNSTYYSAHRIAWYLYHKQDPFGKKIEHIDGNPLNNSINNLKST